MLMPNLSAIPISSSLTAHSHCHTPCSTPHAAFIDFAFHALSFSQLSYLFPNGFSMNWYCFPFLTSRWISMLSSSHRFASRP